MALAAILIAFLALGFYTSVINPLFEAPDENWHYEFIREIVTQHGLPVVDVAAHQPWAHEGLQAPLYYVIGALTVAWANPAELAQTPALNPFVRLGEPEPTNNDNRNKYLHTTAEDFPYHGFALLAHWLRVYSLLLGALTVLFTYTLAREIFPTRVDIPLTATAFVAFLPQFIFISGVISNDNLTVTLSTAALWLSARTLRLGVTPPRTTALAIITGAAMLTKLSGLALLPLAGLAVVAVPALKRDWRAAFAHGASLTLIVALISGWWYARNFVLYGEPFPVSQIALMVGARSAPLNFWQWLTTEGTGLRLSTWGVFGWFNILASPEFYFFYDAIAALGLGGILIALIRRRDLKIELAWLALWIGLCVIAFWRYASEIITTQGRLLFPALAAWAILWAWGIAALIPGRARAWSLGALAGSQLLIAALTPSLFIAPAYRATIVAENSLPATITRLDEQYENGVTLLGARIEQPPLLAPGTTLTITLYQRLGATPPDTNLANFIHVVNSADVIIAQRDSLIGAGNPIPAAPPGIIADTYRVPLGLTVPAPDTWRVQVGLYDRTSQARIAIDQHGDSSTIATLSALPKPDSWNSSFAGKVTLAQVQLAQNQVARGNTLRLTLEWRAVTQPLIVFVHAIGSQDRIWASATAPLTAHMILEVPFDPTTPPGIYPLELGVYPPNGDRLAIFDANGQLGDDRLWLGPVRVTQP